MKVVRLECLLMDNNEVIFLGKSLGFLSQEEIDKYVKEVSKDDPKKELNEGD